MPEISAEAGAGDLARSPVIEIVAPVTVPGKSCRP